MKKKKKEKTEQGSVYSIYLYIYIPLDYIILYYMVSWEQPDQLRVVNDMKD